jgi:hypothetical protein
MVKRLIVLSSLLLFATGAKAGVVIALEGNTQQASGDWIYDITLEQNTQMSAKDFFVIYDIPEISNVSWDPNNEAAGANIPDVAGWSTTEPGAGPVPANLLPNDSPSIANVLVTLQDGFGPITPRPQDVNGLLLGKLTVTTPPLAKGFIDYTSQTAQLSGSPLSVVSSVAGPVPEPSTFGMMGAGLAVVAAFALRRRRQDS